MKVTEVAEVRPDTAVLALAGRRHGVVTTAQLVESGLSKDAITGRVKSGWLRRRHRGVYVVGPLETALTHAMAAVAAYGYCALLSHYPAAVVWGVCRPQAGVMDVTVTGRPVHGRDGIRVHRANLHPQDASRKDGIPITSLARTLLDLAAILPQRELDRAVEEAEVQRRVSTRSLNEQFIRYPTHRGTAALSLCVRFADPRGRVESGTFPVREAIRSDPALTRSEAERRTLELIRAARLPTPEVNARLSGYEVDFLWREHNLIVEVDGYAFHSSRSSFERDRRRDRALQAAGYMVLRITWRELAEQPEAVVAELAAALARPAASLR